MRQYFIKCFWFQCLLALISGGTSAQSMVYYVDSAQVDSAQLGTSWVYAFNNLDSALVQAAAGDTIKVARGTYKPISARGCSDCDTLRDVHFLIDTSIILLGSFDPDTDMQVYNQPSILSGEREGPGLADNVRQVLVIFEAGSPFIDGFTITRGNTDIVIPATKKINGIDLPKERGAACMYYASNPTFSNVRFVDNSGPSATVFAYSDGKFQNCTFQSNTTVSKGSAIELLEGALTLDQVTCIDNHVTASSGDGGALYIRADGQVDMTDCTLIDNTAGDLGGAIYTLGRTTLNSCTLSNNHSGHDGGGLYVNGPDSVTISNCSFTHDSTGVDGGGVFVANVPYLLVSNCRIDSNSARFGGGLYTHNIDHLHVDSCHFYSNHANDRGGAFINLDNQFSQLSNLQVYHNTADLDGAGILHDGSSNDSLTMGNCVLSNNHALVEGGALKIQDISLARLTNCQLDSNSAYDAGGMKTENLGTLELIQTQIINNSATDDGGGIINYNLETGSYINLVVAENMAGNRCGGLFESSSDSVIVSNGLFVQNIAGGFGGGMVCKNSKVEIISSTFYANQAGGQNLGDGLYNMGSSNTQIYNSIFDGHEQDILQETALTWSHTYVDGLRYTASDTVGVDPMFSFPSDPKGTDDVWATPDDGLQLFFCSPLIDMGLDSLTTISTDILLNDRIQLGQVDLGSYESLDDPSIYTGVTRLYVDSANVSGTEDGLSWATAFTRLQDAFLPCISNTGMEIWVARGTYYPDEGFIQISDDRDATFIIPNGAAVYGGFTGIEDSLIQRNWTVNLTKLSGEIQQDFDSINNSQSVFKIVDCIDTVILDGIYVQDGYFNSGFYGAAGGMISNSPAILSNCSLWHNIAADTATANVEEIETFFAGGLYIESGSTVLIDKCNISENESYRGIKLTFIPASFDPITSMNYSAGGIIVSSSSYLHMLLSDVNKNLDDGYAITVSSEKSTAISNSSGGIFVSKNSSAEIRECNINHNDAKASALAHAPKDLIAHSYSAGSLFIDSSSGLSIKRSNMTKNDSRAQASLKKDGMLAGINQRREYSSGGVLSTNSISMSDCTLSQNFACSFSPQNFLDYRCYSAGGLLSFEAKLANLNQCVLSNNRALAETNVVQNSNAHSAGGILITELDSLKVVNCDISNNHSKSTSPNTPVTFSEASGGLLSLNNSNVTCLNTIIWQNNAIVSYNSHIPNKARPDILERMASSLFLQYNLLESYAAGDSTNLVGETPDFVDPGEPATEDSVGIVGNYSLSDTSVAINAGFNSYLPMDSCDLDMDNDSTEYIPYDLNSNPRIQGWTLDIGAYEYDSQDTMYVDHTATGDSTGQSWIDAAVGDFDVLDFASQRGVEVVYIAEGNYPMTKNTSVISGLNLRGGFPNGGGVPDAGLHICQLVYDYSDPIFTIDSEGHQVMLRGVKLIDPSADVLNFELIKGDMEMQELIVE